MENENETATPVVEAEASAAPEAPKLTCDVTIVIQNGEIKPLKVWSKEKLTYGQLKEICNAAAQRVDAEFTAKCTKLGAHFYEPMD